MKLEDMGYRNKILATLKLFSIVYNESKQGPNVKSSIGYPYENEEFEHIFKEYKSIHSHMDAVFKDIKDPMLPSIDYLYIHFVDEFGELPEDNIEADNKCKEIINEHLDLAPFINYYRYPDVEDLAKYNEKLKELKLSKEKGE